MIMVFFFLLFFHFTGNSATSTTSSNEPNSPNYSGDHTAPSLINKQKALPFIPPKFPNNGEDSNALIKPSEYLKSICGTKQVNIN